MSSVTVHFEATDGIQNEDTTNILNSGPIQIFATVDNVRNPEGNPLGEHDLYSPDLIQAIELALLEDPQMKIVVFAKNTEVTKGNSSYRGSYFFFKGFGINKTPNWVEVAVGTHSHDNIEILDLITDLSFGSELKPLYLKAIPNEEGGIEAFELVDMRGVPNLPKYITDNVTPPGEGIVTPDDDLWNHLDAALDELGFIGDINDPNHNATAIGRCSDLYRILQNELDKNLYVYEDEFEIIRLSDIKPVSKPEQILRLSDVIINRVNLQTSPSSSTQYTVRFNNVNLNQVKDELMLFVNESVIQTFTYQYDATSKSLFVSFLKSEISLVLDDILFTLVQLDNDLADHPNNVKVIDIINALGTESSYFNLQNIRLELYKLYVKVTLHRKTSKRRVFLTNDDEGNIVWDNKFTPAGTFKLISDAYKYNEVIKENHIFDVDEGPVEAVKIELDNLYLDSNSAFLVMFETSFVYKTDFSIFGSTLTLWIPTEDNNYYNDNNDEFKLTVLVINNGAAEIADYLADKYVSKNDAVRLIVDNNLDLSDYATKDDLFNKADKNHSHAQYAKKNHNHDGRYADYQHTHPELLAEIGSVSTTAADLVKNYLLGVLSELGYDSVNNEWKVDPTKIDLSEIESEINNLDNYERLDGFDYDELTQVIKALIYEVTKPNELTAKDLHLKNNIVVENPIGLFEPGYVIDTQFSIEGILRGMLTSETDPFIATSINIKFYTHDGMDYIEVPEYGLSELSNTRIYGKIDSLKNSQGQELPVDKVISKFMINGQEYTDLDVEEDIYYVLDLPILGVATSVNIKSYVEYGSDPVRGITSLNTIIKRVKYFEYGFVTSPENLNVSYSTSVIHNLEFEGTEYKIVIPEDSYYTYLEVVDIGINEDITWLFDMDDSSGDFVYTAEILSPGNSGGAVNVQLRITVHPSDYTS